MCSGILYPVASLTFFYAGAKVSNQGQPRRNWKHVSKLRLQADELLPDCHTQSTDNSSKKLVRGSIQSSVFILRSAYKHMVGVAHGVECYWNVGLF